MPAFHPDLVLGVATYALELLRKAPDLDVLYVPIGQGSGICGCILARDLLGLSTEIVGVQSTEAPSYALSFAAGTVVTTNTSNTLADGMATRVPDPDALAIIRKGASRIVQVTDDEIAAAIRAYWTDTHNLAEGAGAAPLAAALQEKAEASRQARRPDPERRQYRFRSVSERWVMARSTVVARQGAGVMKVIAPPQRRTVIVRLDRTIQYAARSRFDLGRRCLLDARIRGHDERMR